MNLWFVLASVILSCLPFLHSATYNNTSKPSCPKSFSCPDFGPFKYPFYDATNRQSCGGLIKVNCTSNDEKVQLGGRSYKIIGKSTSGSSIVIIHNKSFESLVKANKCEALMNNFTSLTPLLFSFTIFPIITLFKCTKNPNHAAVETDAYFHQPNYKSYKKCKHHNFYYKHPIGNTTFPSNLPRTCEVTQLPLKVQWDEDKRPDNGNIFSLLSSTFSISFLLSHSCHKCHKNGGQCQAHNGRFQCLHARKVGKLTLILAGSAFILLLFLVTFILWRRYKSNPFSYFSSKDKSPNIEDGSLIFGVSVFSYAELEHATGNFNPSQELGDGGFGTVYYGKLQDGREVAVKRLYEHNYKRVQQFINEVGILTRLRHPNLVVLYGCTSHQSHELLLVYEYISNGTVADHLHGKRANPSLLTWPMRMNIAIETASALSYLHASEIIHRDVKTNNILLDHKFCVKVADFGLSRLLPNDVTHVSTAPQGTPGYVDPQYSRCFQLTDKSDVYSFGVVLIELISSMVAVDLSRCQDDISLANLALNRIQRCALDELIDPVLGSNTTNAETMRMITLVAELAFRCLQYDSEMRPTMNEVLDVLEDIQAEGRIDAQDSIRELKSITAPPPSENSDTIVLLKDFLPSPVSVTGEWKSNSSGLTALSISK